MLGPIQPRVWRALQPGRTFPHGRAGRMVLPAADRAARQRSPAPHCPRRRARRDPRPPRLAWWRCVEGEAVIGGRGIRAGSAAVRLDSQPSCATSRDHAHGTADLSAMPEVRDADAACVDRAPRRARVAAWAADEPRYEKRVYECASCKNSVDAVVKLD